MSWFFPSQRLYPASVFRSPASIFSAASGAAQSWALVRVL